MEKIAISIVTGLCLLALLISAWKVIMAWGELGKLLGGAQPLVLIASVLWLCVSMGTFVYVTVMEGTLSFSAKTVAVAESK